MQHEEGEIKQTMLKIVEIIFIHTESARKCQSSTNGIATGLL